MKQGRGRFDNHLKKVQELMEKARTEEDPSMWLFSNNARTPFFMLEALSRLYAGIHNRKKFEKLKDRFKTVEDGLGQVDYYNALSVAFETNKKIGTDIKELVKRKRGESSARLSELLRNDRWLSDEEPACAKISSKLKKSEWLKPENEVEEIKDFYKDAIKRLKKFVSETKYLFDNVEEDVHELRRRLRWLSIYPQAMNGVFQFDAASPAPAHVDKYITPEITGSSFNKLPAPGNNTSFLILNKRYFYALSWMIAKLGDLKDEGLLITGLAEMIRETTGCSAEDAMSGSLKLWNAKADRMQQILDSAETLTRTFIKEKNLEKLIVRTNKAGKKLKKPPKKKK